MVRFRGMAPVAWAAALALTTLSAAVLTNLVTGDSATVWIWIGFGIVATASIGLAGAQAVSSVRGARARRKQYRAEALAPIPDPGNREGTPELPALLAARSRLGVFGGRGRELAELLAWCEDPDSERIRILAGESGVGKSRLAVELGAVVPKGWVAGLAVSGRLEMVHRGVVDCGDPTLVIVDDADTVPGVAGFLDQIERHDDRPPIRVLLVVRDAAAFVGSLDRLGAEHLVRSAPLTEVEPIGGDGDRRQWFVNALTAFAAARGVGPVDVTRFDVGPVGFAGETMMVICLRAALAATSGGSRSAVDAVREAGTDQLAEELMRHEMRRWAAIARDPQWAVQGPGVTDAARADAVLALCLHGATSRRTAITVLEGVPRLAGQSAGVLDAIAMWAHALYAAHKTDQQRTAWVEPQSEFIAAALIAHIADINRHDDVLAAVTTTHGKSDHNEDISLIPVTRAAAWFSSAASLAAEIISARPELLTSAIEATALAGPRACQALEPILSVDVKAATLNSSQLASLVDLVSGTWLVRVLVSLRQRQVANARLPVATTAARSQRIKLARSLNNLGNSLGMVGEHREALDAYREGIELWKDEEYSNAGRYVGDMARSFSNLGDSLQNVGDYRDSLSAYRDAVKLFRDLFATQPRRYTNHFLGSLSRLGAAHHQVGEYREALVILREAVGQYRDLVSAEPARYAGELANSLDSLGTTLREVGDYQEALDVSREAVERYRDLVSAEPARYTGDLAKSLDNFGGALSELNEYQNSVVAYREAVGLYRGLAVAEAARYTGELAHSLDGFGAALWAVGEYRESLVALRDAVELYRGLVIAEPARYTGELAGSLNNLGLALSWQGQCEDAHVTHLEAVGLYRDLVVAEPARYTGVLAQSLTNLGAALAENEDNSGSLGALREAVGLYRDLAVAEPARYTAELAVSLNSLRVVLLKVEADDESLRVTVEIAAWWGRLAEAEPDRFGDCYVQALRLTEQEFAAAGRGPGAAQMAVREALAALLEACPTAREQSTRSCEPNFDTTDTG